jgi:hypothetical protein
MKMTREHLTVAELNALKFMLTSQTNPDDWEEIRDVVEWNFPKAVLVWEREMEEHLRNLGCSANKAREEKKN